MRVLGSPLSLSFLSRSHAHLWEGWEQLHLNQRLRVGGGSMSLLRVLVMPAEKSGMLEPFTLQGNTQNTRWQEGEPVDGDI